MDNAKGQIEQQLEHAGLLDDSVPEETRERLASLLSAADVEHLVGASQGKVADRTAIFGGERVRNHSPSL